MKTTVFILITVTAVLVMSLIGSVAAQESGPKVPSLPVGRNQTPQTPLSAEPELGDPIVTTQPHEARLQNIGTATIPVGQSGLSFRYVQTFGKNERAYFDDTTHLNYPYGLSTDGDNVWIADSRGLRAIKYHNDGTFVTQIGKTGFRYGTGESLEFVADVGVDGTGNIWMVDNDAHHVLKFDATGKYLSKLGRSYNPGQGNDRFSGVHSIAFDGVGNVYVSDSWNKRVQVFQSDGSYLATIGTTGVEGSDNGHFCNPQHIAIANNVLYVADACNHRVQLFNVANPQAVSYLATIGMSGQSGDDNAHFNNPLGVAVGANRIYIADENNHRIQVFDRTTLKYQATISQGWGDNNTQLRQPSDVAVDASGNVYVADWFNARVQQFDSNLVYVRTYGTTGVPYVTDNLHYNKPSGMAVAPDGSIYLSEERGQRLIKLDAEGTPQWTIGIPGVIVDTGANNRLNYAGDVALAPSSLVYVTDRSNNRIQIFNPDGSYHATLGTGYGTGNDQFKFPSGLFITRDGTIYVSDSDNHRVQIFNRDRLYVTTLGETDTPGSDNAHFRNPYDVVVDGRGYIYVADLSNYRVQVFDANRNYVRTIGETGTGGNGFDRLNGPQSLAVDTRNNLYVSSSWNHTVHVYDPNGAYLTTIGGNRGNRTGQLADPHGLAFDTAGNLYIADFNNHRIQKYAPSVPGWIQANINGFGDRSTQIASLTSFNGHLYAGTTNYDGNGAELWRTSNGTDWTQVITNGFGIPHNVGIGSLSEFHGQLYAGTRADRSNGGEVWRSSDGVNWAKVASGGFGDPTNGEVFHLTVVSDTLYASTWSYTTTHGAEIWRTDTGNAGDWTQVASNGFGDARNVAVMTMKGLNGHLYAGTRNFGNSGAEVWRYDGSTWTQSITNGFGFTGTYDIAALSVFGGYLYAGTGKWDPGTQSYPGGQIWRCIQSSGCDEDSDWSIVISDGFGKADNINITSLYPFNGHLYAVAYNERSGMEVWRTADGTDWEQTGFAGLGDSNNSGPYWDNGMAVFGNRLYISTYNPANGGEVWLFLHNTLYLPLVTGQ